MDADTMPIVVPFVHSGMQDIMPIGTQFPHMGKRVIMVSNNITILFKVLMGYLSSDIFRQYNSFDSIVYLKYSIRPKEKPDQIEIEFFDS